MRSVTQAPTILTPAACDALPSCEVTPATICPFVSACPAGQAPALLLVSVPGPLGSPVCVAGGCAWVQLPFLPACLGCLPAAHSPICAHAINAPQSDAKGNCQYAPCAASASASAGGVAAATPAASGATSAAPAAAAMLGLAAAVAVLMH